MRILSSVNQLRGYSHTAASATHATFENIPNPKLVANLLDVSGFPFVSETGISRDDEQGLEARERGDDVFHYAIIKILLFGIAGHVLERQDRDGRLIGQRRRALSAIPAVRQLENRILGAKG